jgi:hypothetical protein
LEIDPAPKTVDQRVATELNSPIDVVSNKPVRFVVILEIVVADLSARASFDPVASLSPINLDRTAFVSELGHYC